MERQDLLLEIGTEELPPKALRRLSEALQTALGNGLNKARLHYDEILPYASPRRLALLVRALDTVQAGGMQERRGPALAAAFDADGAPTPAALGFARSCGVEVDQLQTLKNDKGAWLVHSSRQPDHPVQELLPSLVGEALAALPIPKRMRWGSLQESFVRPVHWLVLLLDDEVVAAEFFGLKAGRETRGHRFHHPEPLPIPSPAAYATLLEREGRVLVNFAARREVIRAQVEAAAKKAGGTAVIDEALLEEVTSMVEWPVALVGSFEKKFLEVPPEALVSAMKGHQKYFHIVDDSGRLLPCFVTVSNIESLEPAVVRAGNERVIRPRLADAAFFWEQDRRCKLAQRMPDLEQVIFQKKLGSLRDKCERLVPLAVRVAGALDGNSTLAERAAMMAKCDLLTDMVGEFPELQGIMGRYYARHDGEADEVAEALDEQYMPRFAGDRLPATVTGQALAIAERLDTLVGIFGIGLPPSGDKDPFALRRAALGVLRMLIEQRLDLDLVPLLEEALTGYQVRNGLRFDTSVVEQVFDFMMERLRAYYHEQGIVPDVFEAVLTRRPGRPLDFDARLRAVEAFSRLPEAASLAAANKRISNILRKAQERIPAMVDEKLLQDEAECQLAVTLDGLAAEVEKRVAEGDYTAVLNRLAALRGPVDRFFDEVMVMTEEAELRVNRLALLNTLRGMFLQVADLSCLQHYGA